MSFIAVLTMALTFTAQAQVGFESGSSFQAIPISGQVRVTCSGFNGQGSAIFTCRDIALDPKPYDHFVGPIHPHFNKLELSVQRSDGTQRSRVVEYKGALGKTAEPLNLWISTLFQKPLLLHGQNKIRYKFSGKSKPEDAEEGELEVLVATGDSRVCPSADYSSTDVNDCNSPYSVCQRYFSEYNNCR